MRVSLSWIERLLGAPVTVPLPELMRRLTLATAEIEPEPLRTGPALDRVVVGRVLTCARHPNADRLSVTTVDAGTGAPLAVVCGAPNVAAGQAVAVALPGAVVRGTDKTGAPTTFTIKEGKIRGEASQGMLCAEDELGLSGGHDGILVLDGGLTPGTPLAQALGLGDVALGVENIAITHRPDLWGQWGWAREVAAITGLRAPTAPDATWADDAQGWSVDVRDAGCTAYCGAVVTGVDNGESPAWLRRLLESCGLRPLGLLVDVTNYVMLDLGEPMHAFDRRRIDGTTVSVRAALPDERLELLDGRSLALHPEDLVIADGTRALALAGVMGGVASMVQADTSEIVLEAAVFQGARIRRTRQRHGVATDSSVRFEKGLYGEGVPAAINRAIALLQECRPGCRVTARFHAGRIAGEPTTIAFAADAVRRATGLDVPPAEQVDLLARLGFTGDHARGFNVPWWRRKDVRLAADLVEEVARLVGYERIVPAAPRLVAAAPPRSHAREAGRAARRALSAQGWDETPTYGFTRPAWAEAVGADAARVIVLPHPLSQEQSILRPSLFPNLIEAVVRNRRHLDAVQLYEIGRRYLCGAGRGDTPDEVAEIAGACAAAGDAAPFFAARDAALALLAGLGHPTAAVEPADAPGFTAGRRVELRLGAVVVGEAGEAGADWRRLASADDRIGLFRIDLDVLLGDVPAPRPPTLRVPSRFPAVTRDFTWLAAQALPWAALDGATRQAAGALCREIALVDIYRGDGVPAGQQAVTLRLTLQADDRTLEEAELGKLQGRIVAAVAARTQAVLRG